MRFWTEDEKQFLRANAHRMSAKEIGEKLNRTAVSIACYANLMRQQGYDVRLQKTGENHHEVVESDKTVELCRALRDEGLKLREIAEKMDVALGTVMQWCSYRSRV